MIVIIYLKKLQKRTANYPQNIEKENNDNTNRIKWNKNTSTWSFYKRGDKAMQLGKDGLLNNWCCHDWCNYRENKHLNLEFSQYSFYMICRPNCKI